MYVDAAFLSKKFDEFNALIFGGCLPRVPIRLSKSGRALASMCISYPDGKRASRREYRLMFTARYDLPQLMAEDILIHEMIHLLIATRDIADNGPHGAVFRSYMHRINAEYGRHIAVSFKLPDEVINSDTALSRIYVITCRLKKDNVKVIMRCASTFIYEAYRRLSADDGISDIRMYGVVDPYFSRYANSRTIKFYLLTDDAAGRLAGAAEFVMEGGRLRLLRVRP